MIGPMKFLCIWLVVAACGTAEVRNSRFAQRPAWTIETPQLRVTILEGGGHVAEIVLAGESAVNPLWVQARPTIDPDQYNPALHDKVYGPGSGARLMSGLAGHNVCFPYWGDPSPAEARAGMTYHGETGVVRWVRLDAPGDRLRVAADLPESLTRFVRAVEVAGQVAYFDETGENRSGWDRPLGWCEHVTLGAPFLEKGVTRIDASLTRGRVNGEASGAEFAWPNGRAEAPIDLRTVRNVEKSGFVNNFLVDPGRRYGYFVAAHPGRRLLFGYIFVRAEFPWLNIWEANNPTMLTRGMEFSNTPTHGTMRALVAAPLLWGTRAFEWLDGKGSLRKRFAAFAARSPENWRGTADVSVREGGLEIVETGPGRVVTLAFEESRLVGQASGLSRGGRP